MTATITVGSQTVTPDLVLGYTAGRTAQAVVHPIIGRPDPDVTLREVLYRAGSLTLLFLDRTDAFTALSVLSGVSVAVLVDDEVPEVNMAFVVTGELTLTPDGQDIRRWNLTVPFQEVAA